VSRAADLCPHGGIQGTGEGDVKSPTKSRSKRIATKISKGSREDVANLQRDLRRLGYLQSGIDGHFGKVTESAVRALQYDLLHNSGRGPDGVAPVSVSTYNRSRVTAITGPSMSILRFVSGKMIEDEAFTKIPCSPKPREENAAIVASLSALDTVEVPVPFLVAILQQESGLRHYREPSPGNADAFLLVGLDRKRLSGSAITSRGYGIGQHTLFHHPPSQKEVNTLMLDHRRTLGRRSQSCVRSSTSTLSADRLALVRRTGWPSKGAVRSGFAVWVPRTHCI